MSDQIKGVVRDQYMVSLVSGGEEGERNYRKAGMAAMVGAIRTINKFGLTRDDVDKLYDKAAQLVYGRV